MLSKCLNPACSTPFRYLRDGRIFNLTLPQPTVSSPAGTRREFFWLCGRCVATLTISIRNGAVIVESRFLELPSGERIEQSEDEIPYPARAI